MIRWLLLTIVCVSLLSGFAASLADERPLQRLHDAVLGESPPELPSAEVQHLADLALMTDRARDIFYRARPQIDTNRALFEKHCKAIAAGNGVELGCYTSDDHIYILNIDNPELANEMVVAASHEMLHAAYARLSRTDRAAVIQQLEAQAPKIADRGFAVEMRQYRLVEPGQQDNEMHSLIGTEYAPLSPDLEAYYGRYFSDRRAIVSYSTGFKEAFSSLQDRLQTLESQIKQMRQQMSTDLSRRQIVAYNALVPRLNGLVKEYNDAVDHYNLLSRSLMGTEPTASEQ